MRDRRAALGQQRHEVRQRRQPRDLPPRRRVQDAGEGDGAAANTTYPRAYGGGAGHRRGGVERGGAGPGLGQPLPGRIPPELDGRQGVLMGSVRVQVHGHVVPDIVEQWPQEAQVHLACLPPGRLPVYPGLERGTQAHRQPATRLGPRPAGLPEIPAKRGRPMTEQSSGTRAREDDAAQAGGPQRAAGAPGNPRRGVARAPAPGRGRAGGDLGPGGQARRDPAGGRTGTPLSCAATWPVTWTAPRGRRPGRICSRSWRRTRPNSGC